MMKKMLSAALAAALCLSLLSACGSQSGGTPSEKPEEKVDLAAFAQGVQEDHEFGSLERADAADEVGAVMLENTYPGLKDMDLEQLEAYLSMISFSGGELALAQAKTPEDAAKVKQIFQDRIDAKTTEGPGNYPEEVEMWQKYAKVADHGSYVMLVNHQDADAIVSEFEAQFQ